MKTSFNTSEYNILHSAIENKSEFNAVYSEVIETSKSTSFLEVSPQYRTNPLSHKPANNTVEVVYENSLRLSYSNIHYPKKYIKYLSRDICHGEIVSVFINDKEVDYEK